MSLCGNGVLDSGEDCDTSAGVTCQSGPFHTGAGFTCNASCQCACPAFVEFTGTSGGIGVLDTGQSGFGHRSTVVSDGTVTVGVTSCAGTSRPCGVCNVAGPVENIRADIGEIFARRCTGNTRTKCTANADCSTAGGTCEFYFGSYLPLSAGGVSTCVGNQINGAITGTANIETGTAATNVGLISKVYTGTATEPCPKCVGDTTTNDGVRGGTCSSGPNATLSCDGNGSSPNPFWKTTSLDCPPTAGALVGTLGIALNNGTGTQTRTLSAANPNCTAVGYTGSKCPCDTCNNSAAQACAGNADCPVSGRCVGGTNGGVACTTASQCLGGGTCNGRPCTLGTQCASGVCTSGFCSTTQGICGGPAGQRCISGANAGAPCSSATQCPGSSCGFVGQATAFNACADTICSATSTCVGGTNENADCTATSECPGGTCVAGNKGSCGGGPFEQYCGPNGTFQGCTSDADCASLNVCVGGTNNGVACSAASVCPGGTCQSLAGSALETCSVGKFRPCFLDNGTIGGSDDATGVASVPVNDQSNPTLASLFCIGPTTSGSVNSAAGLPGLGRLELPGLARGLP